MSSSRPGALSSTPTRSSRLRLLRWEGRCRHVPQHMPWRLPLLRRHRTALMQDFRTTMEDGTSSRARWSQERGAWPRRSARSSRRLGSGSCSQLGRRLMRCSEAHRSRSEEEGNALRGRANSEGADRRARGGRAADEASLFLAQPLEGAGAAGTATLRAPREGRATTLAGAAPAGEARARADATPAGAPPAGRDALGRPHRAGSLEVTARGITARGAGTSAGAPPCLTTGGGCLARHARRRG